MQDCLIIGAGSTIKHYKKMIEKFIKENDLETIGVNNVSHMFKLDYNLWTNNKRFEKYFPQIHVGTKLILTPKILSCNCFPQPCPITIRDDINKWRTAGLRAIQYAHENDNIRNIFCVGFDGYSLVFGGDQHCYGKGMTDLQDMKKQKDMKYEVEKDDLVYSQMRRMKKEGVKFEILTHSVFEEFYNGSLL